MTNAPRRSLVPVALCALALAAAASPALAQKMGDTFKDERLGLSVRVPDKYDPIPIDPNEYYILAKFNGPKEIEYQRDRQILYPSEMYVVRIPTNEKATVKVKINGEEREIEIPESFRAKTVKDYFEKTYRKVEWKSEKDVTIGGRPAKQLDCTVYGLNGEIGTRFLATVFPTEDAEYGVVGGILASKFDKYAPAFRAAAKTFKLDAAKLEAAIKADKDRREAKAEGLEGYDSASLAKNREEKTQWAEQTVKSLPGWFVLPTDHYVIVSNTDKAFCKEIGKRLETLRTDIYEKMFPPEKPINAVSIVRVCKNLDEYHAYGGPGGSAGYWNSHAEELVMFDNKDNDREYTFEVMYHEAFHQYIHYAAGELPPHSWFNEGTGDYFSGHKYKNGKFSVGKCERTETIRNAVREGKAFPLRKFLYMEQSEYYSQPDVAYAQGWAFVYFLREGTSDARWKAINTIYFDTLKSEFARHQAEGKPEHEAGRLARKTAVDKAIDGVDLGKLQEAFFKFCEGI
jgi:hypothetical protein